MGDERIDSRLDRRELLVRGGKVAAAGAVASLAGAPIALGREAAGKKVALISTQKAGDRGVVDDMVSWLNKAGKQLGVQTRFIQALDPSTYQSTLQATAQAGFDIVATTFPGMQKPLAAVAPQFKNTRFIHIYGDPDKTAIANLVRVRYAFWEGTFLAGVLAGYAAKKPAFVGGEPIPNIIADANAYKLGVVRVNRAAKVKVVFSGSGFSDPGKAHDADAGVLGAGYDWIMSDDEQQGPLRAAKEKNTFVVLEEPHFFAEAPKNVPAVVIIKFGESLYGQIQRALGSGFKGGLVSSGVHDKVVGLDISTLFLKQGPPDVAAKVKAARPKLAALSAQIVAGTVKVPFVPKL